MAGNKDWFTTIGTPKRDNNLVAPFADGEECWSHVRRLLGGATKTIHMTFWKMELDMEVTRDAGKTFKEPADRYDDTIRKILLDKKNKGVAVRILLWDPPGSLFLD